MNGLVTLVRVLEGGDVMRTEMLPEVAMLMLPGYGVMDGREVVSARIDWGGVNAREYDMGGYVTGAEGV